MRGTLVLKGIDYSMRLRRLGLGREAQRYIDAECIRLMAPFTPIETGTMRDSAWTMTAIGSGLVAQATPYVRKQYYDESLHHRGMGTHHWFEAMKSNGGVRTIYYGVVAITGARR